ncbi:MAG: hypothetical protein N3A38_12930, partial [Planctomycetota bacterium]|nr:hypothetical protein [Planctomycetota bacterium]
YKRQVVTGETGAAPGSGDGSGGGRVFEFAEKPKVTRRGDEVTISFAVRDFCDATVAIEGRDGRILRHLASGVLGKNAPPPFQKDSLKQTVVWDGKDEQGAYVDDKDNAVVRVSLGLKARLERSLLWSPKTRTRDPQYLDGNLVFAAAPEGIYVYDGGSGDHVRLFDHDGNYVRTVYPPPAGKLKDFDGLLWREFPQDGARLPLKWGLAQCTFLTTAMLGAGGQSWPVDGNGDVRAMAAFGDRLMLACERINRLAADGGTGGARLGGPDVFVPTYVPGAHEWRGGVVNVPPTDAAFSPDGRWIYFAGYMWSRSWMHGLLNGVGRVPADGSGPLENFAGSLCEVTGSGRVEKSFVETVKGNPPAPGQIAGAVSVATDPSGRVYVADHLNSRIRVFDPSGRPLKDIPFEKPAFVRVNPKNGEIYVFRYPLPIDQFKASASNPCFARLGPFEDPKVLASAPLETTGWCLDSPPCRIAVDFWTDPPTIWFCDKARSSYDWGPPDRYERTCAKLLVEKDGKLAVRRDFGKEAKAETGWLRGPRHMKRRLYFNPKNRKLYVGDLHAPAVVHATSMREIAIVDPDTGKVSRTVLPFDAEDMAFDINGLAYLRTFDAVARYDPENWREIPFDYGDHSPAVSCGLFPAKVISAVTFAGVGGIASGQLGGMAVSPKGHLVVTVANPERAAERRDEARMGSFGTRPYTPRIYPGRSRPWEVHVFDRHGKPLYADAVPGVGRMVGINMDRDDNIYVMLAGIAPVGGKPYFNPLSCSLIKLRPGTKFYSTNAVLPMADDSRPNRPPDFTDVDTCGSAWVENPCWIRGGVGFDGKRFKCHCPSQSRPALDFFARSFVPEPDHYSVLVLDSAGNEMLRIGRYGNVDDGVPLIRDGGPPNPRPIGDDEVALMHPQMLAVESDRRLFIGDLGNARIASVRLDYRAGEEVPLKDIPDQAEMEGK